MSSTYPVPFPIKGLNTTASPHAVPQGFSPDLLNVRPHDPIKGQLRGGSRQGLTKWGPGQLPGEVQSLTKIDRASAFDEGAAAEVLYVVNLTGTPSGFAGPNEYGLAPADGPTEVVQSPPWTGSSRAQVIGKQTNFSTVSVQPTFGVLPDGSRILAGSSWNFPGLPLDYFPCIVRVDADNNVVWSRQFFSVTENTRTNFRGVAWTSYDPDNDLVLALVLWEPVYLRPLLIDEFPDLPSGYRTDPTDNPRTNYTLFFLDPDTGATVDRLYLYASTATYSSGLPRLPSTDNPGNTQVKYFPDGRMYLSIGRDNTLIHLREDHLGAFGSTFTAGPALWDNSDITQGVDADGVTRWTRATVLLIDTANRKVEYVWDKVPGVSSSVIGYQSPFFKQLPVDDFSLFGRTSASIFTHHLAPHDGFDSNNIPTFDPPVTYAHNGWGPVWAVLPNNNFVRYDSGDDLLRLIDGVTNLELAQFSMPSGPIAPNSVSLNDSGTELRVGTPRQTTWAGSGGDSANLFGFSTSDLTLNWAYMTPGTTISTNSLYQVLSLPSVSAPINPSPTSTSAVVAIGSGTMHLASPAGVTLIPGGSGALSDAFGRVQTEYAFGRVFAVDGTADARVYDFAGDQLSLWSTLVGNEGAGDFPVGSGSPAPGPRLITLYRGRMILSGISNDPNNWYMSKAGAPFDFDTDPTPTTATDAVAGNLSPAGLVGDLITALIPLSDDMMLFGCDSSIWAMAGDPAAGGVIDLVSDKTGIAFGRAWAKDPANTVYFAGLNGIYRMSAGSPPESLTTGRLDREFQGINLDLYRYLLAWDFRRQGLIVIIAPVSTALATYGYFWDQRTDSWWKDSYPPGLAPCALLSYDAAHPTDADLLLGCRDGYIRKFSPNATQDDGVPLPSYFRTAPFAGPDPVSQVLVQELNLVLASDSSQVYGKLFTGQTCEEVADGGTLRVKRTFKAGRSASAFNRVSGHAVQLEVGSESGVWGVERMSLTVADAGRTRRHTGGPFISGGGE